MLVIRKEQMKVFEEYTFRSFINRVSDHVVKIWPELCTEMGEVAFKGSIERGIKSAFAYGINTENDIVGYIDLMYIFGFDFTSDPNIPWAIDILLEKNLHPHKKMEMLYEMAEQALEISGKNLNQ